MTSTAIQHEETPNATSDSWLARLVAFIAWLFSSATKLKRIRATTRFKSDWRDRYAELLPVEWHRHQMLAQGAALLLSGRTLNDADYQHIPMPPDFGGPRPRPPFEIARRWLVITDFLKNPEAHILRHAARIAKRASVSGCPLRHASHATSPSLRLEEENARRCLSSSARSAGEVARAHSARDGGGSRAPPFSTRARAPPMARSLNLTSSPPRTVSRPGSHSRVRSQQTGEKLQRRRAALTLARAPAFTTIRPVSTASRGHRAPTPVNAHMP